MLLHTLDKNTKNTYLCMNRMNQYELEKVHSKDKNLKKSTHQCVLDSSKSRQNVQCAAC